MNILILANSSSGLFRFRRELLLKLIENKHEVVISVPFGYNTEDLINMSCQIIDTQLDRRGINPFTDMKLIINYFKIMSKVKPDMVITYTIKPNIYGGIVCRIKKIPVYTNITGIGTAFQNNGFLTKLVTLLYKFALKKANKVFFENIENSNIFINKNIVKKAQTCCLNGAGVNLSVFNFEPYPPDGKIHFLFIGRIMKEKGINELFSSAIKLKKEGYDTIIDIVGPFEEDYKKTVEKLDDSEIIKYHGYQPDVRPYIRQAHCFVLPSYHEGMANTLLESGAMGRPLITSNIHGCKEAVIDKKSGFLCEVKNADDLYKKMMLFIKLPYEEKKKMGQNSHDHIAKIFDKNQVVKKTIEEVF